jgi:hypothetical protein
MHYGVMLFGTPEQPRLARLVQLTSEGIPRDVYHLYRDETVVGRESGDVVFTDDVFLSRRHAAFKLDRAQRRVVVRDLGSSNGTLVLFRGEREIVDGDVFRIGHHLFRFDAAPRRAVAAAPQGSAMSRTEPRSRPTPPRDRGRPAPPPARRFARLDAARRARRRWCWSRPRRRPMSTLRPATPPVAPSPRGDAHRRRHRRRPHPRAQRRQLPARRPHAREAARRRGLDNHTVGPGGCSSPCATAWAARGGRGRQPDGRRRDPHDHAGQFAPADADEFAQTLVPRCRRPARGSSSRRRPTASSTGWAPRRPSRACSARRSSSVRWATRAPTSSAAASSGRSPRISRSCRSSSRPGSSPRRGRELRARAHHPAGARHRGRGVGRPVVHRPAPRRRADALLRRALGPRHLRADRRGGLAEIDDPRPAASGSSRTPTRRAGTTTSP